jgi:biopolymer transport protein ExbD
MNFKPSASRSRRGLVRLELTSMIDVIFLLLVYFILSTTYQPPESQLAPALRTQSDASGRSSELTPQIVDVGIIGGEPGFQIGSRVLRSKKALTELLAGLSREGGVVVRGSPAARVEQVAAALQACRDADFAKVTYVPAK